MNKKIGPLLLSGLMIGPILGSGIILLPPLAYSKLGTASIWSWIIIMVLGALFAMIFSKLSVIHPGDGGMTIAIEQALGKKLRLYSSLLMISAVSFGPTAVLLTAADYLNKLQMLSMVSKSIIALILVIISLIILLNDVQFISTLSFVLSSIIAITLIISSIIVLSRHTIEIDPIQTVEILPLGKVVLLLFWAIIGWEIIGNYSNQVRDIKKTIPQATIISIIVITLTYILISLAIQAFPYSEALSMVQILQSVFGRHAKIILSLFVTGLCLCTYLLIVGALGQLIYSLSSENYLPKVFQRKNKNNIPYIGIMYFITMHIIVLTFTHFEILNIEGILSIANGFFLANAVIGLIASLKIIDGLLYRIGGIILSISLLVILSFSSIEIFIALGVVFLLTLYIDQRRENTILTTNLK
jgi:APA family basic amino acid/polyamine antiporter